jgi:hypothetical protein
MRQEITAARAAEKSPFQESRPTGRVDASECGIVDISGPMHGNLIAEAD